MLTREELYERPSLNMFSFGISSSSNKNSKLRIFKDPLSKEERDNFLNYASKKEVDRYLAFFVIHQINTSAMKIQILERWEKEAFKGLENSLYQLQNLNHVWIITTYTDGR